MLALFFASFQLLGQDDKTEKNAVTFEELYDEPYAVNKLFIGFQPLYAELFTTNVNAGFGVDAHYYYQDKADFKAHLRKTYGQQFYDLNRELAARNSDVDNIPEIFNYFEIGGTYHIKDFEAASKTKMILYKNSYKGNKWASRVPLQTEVPSKLRRIYGARLGAVIWNSTTHLNSVLAKQGMTNADLVNSAGVGLPLSTLNPETNLQKEFNVFSNVFCTAIYAGGSITRIRNVAVAFDNYEGAADDGIVTYFFDIMYAPQLKVDPVKYNDDEYSAEVIKTSAIGFRLGMDGKFNRTLSWGYGGEVGMRPSMQGRTFFAMFKLTFPMFSTNLDNKVESFQK